MRLTDFDVRVDPRVPPDTILIGPEHAIDALLNPPYYRVPQYDPASVVRIVVTP